MRNRRFDEAKICGLDPQSPTRQGDDLPIPHQQHHPDRPDHRPQWHQHHEACVLGLMPEEHHAEPAAYSPAQARHPQQRPLRDAAASFVLRLGLVHAVKDEAQEVDKEEVYEKDNGHIENHFIAIQITAPTATAKPTAKNAIIRFRSLSLLAIQATLFFMLAISSTLRFSLST